MAIISATVFFVLHIHAVYHFYTINYYYMYNQLGTSSGVKLTTTYYIYFPSKNSNKINTCTSLGSQSSPLRHSLN